MPTSMLKGELKELFPDKIVEHLTHDEFESCIMFNLSYEDLRKISEDLGEVLIHEIKYSKDKEIIIK